MYLAPQNIPRAVVLILGNTVILYCTVLYVCEGGLCVCWREVVVVASIQRRSHRIARIFVWKMFVFCVMNNVQSNGYLVSCISLQTVSFFSSWGPFLTGPMFVRPNILRTLRRTMIRFLIELLVRRIWFGQSKLYFILSWLVMRCKLRPELAADAQ